MSEKNAVVDARSRFRGGAESPEQRKQALTDGAVALEALKTCKRLPLDDRKQIARRIGFCIHTDKVDRALLAKRAGLEPKELYRLTLGYGAESADKSRFRAAGKSYATVIETLSGLLRPPANVADFADRMTRGTSVHPSDTKTGLDVGLILNLLYDLVDGINEEFHLIQKFHAISRMKMRLPQRDPWTLWPAQLSEDDWKERDREESRGTKPWEDRLQSSFWIVRTEEEQARELSDIKFRIKLAHKELTEEEIEYELLNPTFQFENWHWDQVVGYLPHFFLGHQQDFDWDFDYWPSPQNLAPGSEEERLWPDQLADNMFGVVGRQTTISTAWDDRNQLLFNGDPSHIFRRRIYKFQVMSNAENNPDNWEYNPEDEDFFPRDTPAFFWLCLYPNADASGIVPVLLSTDGHYTGNENTIEPLNERLLSNIDSYPVLGRETLGARLRRALLVSHDRQEPLLKAEWRRTAQFIERHPLWRKHQEYEATARHIKKWRGQVLKGGPVPSSHQEKEL